MFPSSLLLPLSPALPYPPPLAPIHSPLLLPSSSLFPFSYASLPPTYPSPLPFHFPHFLFIPTSLIIPLSPMHPLLSSLFPYPPFSPSPLLYPPLHYPLFLPLPFPFPSALFLPLLFCSLSILLLLPNHLRFLLPPPLSFPLHANHPLFSIHFPPSPQPFSLSLLLPPLFFSFSLPLPF